MRLISILYGLVAHLLPLVSATALTYKLSPNEKACFFSYVEEKGAKLAFYFAVNSLADPVLSTRAKESTKDNVWCIPFNRFNLEALSMSTTASSVLETISSWARRRSDRATSSSPRKRRASTDSALITIWAHLPRSLLILKSQYGLPLSSPFCSLLPWGGLVKT